MKKNILRLAAITLLSGCFALGATAQEKNKIKVRVEKEINGKKTVQERTIDTSNMSEDEQQSVLDSVQTALMGDNFGRSRVKITIEDSNESIGEEKENRFEWRNDDDESRITYDDDGDFNQDMRVYRFKSNKPHVIIKKRGSNNRNFDWDSEEWENDFERGMSNLNNRLRYLGDEIPRRIENGTPLYRLDNQLLGGNSAPIKSIDVYPNRPDSHIINVRFYAPNEGNVSIKVLNIEGKVVAQESAPNFKGEYVGQIELKKNSKGTYFVIISQGDDGLSKRITLD
ncbi:MAG: hypothetical protein ACI9V1_002923 [Spirosomataceae bacterium]|jgi:hypothetical protein